jgi:hypothetical protein
MRVPGSSAALLEAHAATAVIIAAASRISRFMESSPRLNCATPALGRVDEILPEALIVRTAAFFGPWDRSNILTRALAALRAGRDWTVPGAIISPTYVPDLANTALDLLIDGERGVWHLANGGAVSWLEFVHRGAALMGVDTTKLREEQEQAGRLYRVLGNQRGTLLPPGWALLPAAWRLDNLHSPRRGRRR